MDFIISLGAISLSLTCRWHVQQTDTSCPNFNWFVATLHDIYWCHCSHYFEPYSLSKFGLGFIMSFIFCTHFLLLWWTLSCFLCADMQRRQLPCRTTALHHLLSRLPLPQTRGAILPFLVSGLYYSMSCLLEDKATFKLGGRLYLFWGSVHFSIWIQYTPHVHSLLICLLYIWVCTCYIW